MIIHSKSDKPSTFGFLQVRPMVVSHSKIDLTDEEMTGDNVLLASDRVLGNGIFENIEDVIFVDPDNFEAKNTRQIAMQLSELNKKILDEKRNYLLIGFGRWGSSEPNARHRRPAIRADWLWALGKLRSVAGDTGGMGANFRGAGDR